jgi:hypothetical protein
MRTCTECQRDYADEMDFCPRDGKALPRLRAATEFELNLGLSQRYRVVRKLGEGGMGSVFLAEQLGLKRMVAVKVLRRRLLDDPEFLSRFQDEALSLGRINHQNVVTVYECAQTDDGLPYIAMQFSGRRDAGGGAGSAGSLPLPKVAEILQQAARGLHAAHKLEIVHRDLKPDNIFLAQDDEGRLLVKIVDFGISKMRESPNHTSTGAFIGTGAYMSPEQASGMKSEALDNVQAAGADAVPATPSGVSTPAANAANIAGDGSRGSGAVDAPGVGGVPGAPGVLEAQGGGGHSLRSADTVVPVPGESGAGYPARYVVKELADLNASHSGTTFQPNPKYALKNDRNYANAVNQGKIIAGASRSEFNPALHITDNPDATNGPMITDADANVLGGNGRKMMLDRAYAGNPEGAADYRALLKSKAEQFGIDPAAVDAMKQPVLTREVPDSALPDVTAKQKAVTDFNKKGTAELTPAERAIADSRQVSSGTLEDIAGRLDAKGPDATLAQVLEGKAGGEVLNKLVSDGVISPQERAAFMEGSGPREGELTPAGKTRISQLMLARFFRDPAQIESMAPEIRNRVERIAAPLAQVESKPDWNLTPHLKDALEIVENARQRKATIDDSLKQDGLFGSIQHDPKAITLAKALKSMKSQDLTAGARQYAGDANFASKGPSMRTLRARGRRCSARRLRRNRASQQPSNPSRKKLRRRTRWLRKRIRRNRRTLSRSGNPRRSRSPSNAKTAFRRQRGPMASN